LVVGAIAALLIFQYVSGIEEKAQGDAQLVKVLVAKSDIAKGTPSNGLIDSAAVGLADRRVSDLPAGAVKRPEEIRERLAAIDLPAGTVITKSMFVATNQLTNSNATQLRENMAAVTISSDQVRGVAGLIRQGDYVNMIVKGECGVSPSGQPTVRPLGSSASTGADTSAADTAARQSCAGQLYQKVRILALGQSLGSPVVATAPAGATPSTTAAPSSDLITFEVPIEAAQVITAAGPGSITLALVRPDYEPHVVPVTPVDVPMEGTEGKTPYGGDPEATTTGGQ
jgi:Flp pilus assembly protein CpaB